MRASVLIVDDDPMLLSLLSDTLSSVGYEIRSAPNGEEALERINNGDGDVDIIIADISMPGIDGLELLRRVKSRRPDIPVILMTGVSMQGIRTKALEEGADGFLDKPFRLAAVEKLMSRLLNGDPAHSDRIMIIDDNAEHLESLKDILTEGGYEVLCAENGEEALLMIKRGSVDTVITDFRMPEMNGIELARRIKKMSPSTQVIVYSGYAPNDQEASEIRSAADAFLTKPVSLDQMNEILAHA